MNAIIANILKDKLGTLVFIDKAAGLVQVAERAQPTEIEGAFVVNRFPISNDVDFEECFRSGCFKDLVPNSKNKGILYFEDFGCTPTGHQKGGFQYRSKIRLVCWVNNKLIQGKECSSIAHLFITEIRNKLETGPFNQSNVSRINITASNIVSNDYKLFERYTYPKEILKYLMHPYEAFGIDFNVEFTMSKSCMPEIVLDPDLC